MDKSYLTITGVQERLIFSIPLFCLLAIIFYFRGEWLIAHVSSALFIPVFVLFILSVYFCWAAMAGHLIVPIGPTTLFFMAWLVNLLIHVVIASKDCLARIIIEVLMNYAIYITMYFLVRDGMVCLRSVINILIWAGLPLVLLYVNQAFQLESISRIKGFGGVNHVGHAFAILSVAILYKVNVSHRLLHRFLWLFLLLCSLFAMLLTGARSAIIGFVLGGVILLSSKYFVVLRRYISLVGAIPFAAGLILMHFTDASSLFNRLCFIRFKIAILDRIAIWVDIFKQVNLGSMFMGLPEEYNAVLTGGVSFGAVPPHNIFISFLFYNGLIVMLIFLLALFSTISKTLKLIKSKKLVNEEKSRIITLLAMFLVALVYSSLSGQYTRIMTIFVFFGILDAVQSRYCGFNGDQCADRS